MNVEEKKNRLKEVNKLTKSGKSKLAFTELKNIATPDDEFPLQARYSKLFRLMEPQSLDLRPIKIALLGSSTLDHFADVFRYWLAVEGFDADLYLGTFNTFRQDVLDPEGHLYQFGPELVWLFTNERDVSIRITPGTNRSVVTKAVLETVEEYKLLWNAIRERSQAHVVQNNAEVPATRIFGNFEGTAVWSRANLIRAFNLELAAAVTPGTSLFDLEHVASLFGKNRWYDPRYWFHSKHAFTLDASGTVAFHAARFVGGLKGTAKKCVVLDLDNTLWGGVIGDEGIEGIRLGDGADGEAFVAFQEYLQLLKQRGIILAVCSKNEEDAAKDPFLRHPDMRLTLEDIAVFRANWQNKADNIREIVGTLNIGMDAVVFVDDNPAERELVKTELASITVPEIPDDPAEYVPTLDRLCLFETGSFSVEDSMRSVMYRENALRQEFGRQFTDLSEYLRGLNMEATIGDCDSFHLSRMAQLVNKSNQFHLTGTRYTENELASVHTDPTKSVRYFKLRDRFGDNGLISVLVLAKNSKALMIDTWVMSCRVLSRGMEELICKEIVNIADQSGCREIIGIYVPSKKNRLVSGLYDRLGFEKIREEEGGATFWRLGLGDTLPEYETHIRISRAETQEER